MAESWGTDKVRFLRSFGELLPLREGSFDLVVCHTVIEHVADVSKVIAEMCRVLSPVGVIHLEAPNYLWPREPHLRLWCLPFLGKRHMRMLARLQGRGRDAWYLDHLRLVTPHMLQAKFRQHGLGWRNLAEEKIRLVAAGDIGSVKEYRRTARLLRLVARVHGDSFVTRLAIAVGIYPSVVYGLSGAKGWKQRGTTSVEDSAWCVSILLV